MDAFDFDLFVIGAGSGGVRAARIAAGYGAKVAIAEKYRVGGTCVIRGCVPKKLLVYASRFPDEFEDANGFGWSIGETEFSWPALIAAKDTEIARLEAVYTRNLANDGVTLLESRASLADAHTVHLEKFGQIITAEKILIATGGGPNRDTHIPGIEHAITSNEAFHLPALPRRIVIAGGGYVAVEFAGIFAGLGAETQLLYRGDKILRGFDEDLRNGLTDGFKARGITVRTQTRIQSIIKTETGLIVSLVDGGTIETDQVMLAVGRCPNTHGFGLDTAGVALGPAGEVIVDRQSRSSVPNIFAVGDVTDRVNLTPVAIREGHAFADTEFGKKPWAVDHTLIPTAVFSTPEIGTVGLSEADARIRAPKIDIYKTRFRTMKATISGRDEKMFMKLVVDSETQKVLGCHVLGPDAAEIVQMAGIALTMGATKQDFDRTIALHPSVAEELVTLRDKWVPPATG